MKTLEDIRQRCYITPDGHWLWRGARRPNGRANIYAPDYTSGDGVMRTQHGPRAVWHCLTGQSIPAGYRVFGTCEEAACVNPDHLACMRSSEYGRNVRKTGAFKGQIKRIIANRAINRARSKLTPELIAQIQASTETGVALAARLGLRTGLVSRARRGEMTAFAGAGAGLFSGLVRPEAANDGKGRRTA